MSEIVFDAGFAQFVCNNLPVGLLQDLSQTYYEQENLNHADEIDLRKALDKFRSGDRLT